MTIYCSGITAKNERCGRKAGITGANCWQHSSQVKTLPLPLPPTTTINRKIPKPISSQIKANRIKDRPVDNPKDDQLSKIKRKLEVAEQKLIKAEEERAKAEEERAKAEEERAKAEEERAKAEEIHKITVKRMNRIYQDLPNLNFRPTQGYIYAMTHDTLEDQNIFKIGRTQNIEGRLGTYKTSGIKPRMVGVIHVDCVDLNSVEKYIHSLLFKLQVDDKLGMGQELFRLPGLNLIKMFGKIQADIAQHGKIVTETRDDLIREIAEPEEFPSDGHISRMTTIEQNTKDLSKSSPEEIKSLVRSTMDELWNQSNFFVEKIRDESTVEEDDEVHESEDGRYKINQGTVSGAEGVYNISWNPLKAQFGPGVVRELNLRRKNKLEASPEENYDFYTGVSYGKGQGMIDTINYILHEIHALNLYLFQRYQLRIKYSRGKS